MTKWKALCRELVTAIESNCKEHVINHDLNCAYMKADTALSQPEPEGLTDEELLQTYGGAIRDYCYEGPIDDSLKRAMRAATIHGLRVVLDRCGK